MKYQIDKNTIWYDERVIIVDNNSPYPSVCKLYQEFKKNELGSRLVYGNVIPLHDLSSEQLALVKIISEAQNALLLSVKFDKNIEPIE